MYTREEILKAYKNIPFPKSIFEESELINNDIILYQNSTSPSSSLTKDISTLSQSYVLPRRILLQKNNMKNLEFFRAGNFTPNSEPLIDIKIENFKKIYDKFGIPFDKKIIYLKKINNISGPYNYEELENMYKNKKFDSNYDYRLIDLYIFESNSPFTFKSLKNINQDNYEKEFIDSPLLEYSELFAKVKELLEASKKRKTEINSLNDEIDELKNKNEEKDNEISNLKEMIKKLEYELIDYKNKEEEKTKIEKIENEIKKENNKEQIIQKKELEKDIIYDNIIINNNNDDKKKKKKKRNKTNIESENNEENEREEIIEIEKKEIEYIPKILDMGGEWEIAGKKKKIKEESNKILDLPKKEDNKNKSENLTKNKKNKKIKKNEISGEELVELLRPKKKEEPKIEDKNPLDNSNVNSTNESKSGKIKGKKKNKKQYEDLDINLGFKY